jgi:NAD(P)-dependent dehydrogenase (short-subunit alcohol dehydrogenase family)
MSHLHGRVALVTGATQGLGEGVALRLASCRAQVAINGRSEERGAHVLAALRARGARAEFLPADVSDRERARQGVESSEISGSAAMPAEAQRARSNTAAIPCPPPIHMVSRP